MPGPKLELGVKGEQKPRDRGSCEGTRTAPSPRGWFENPNMQKGNSGCPARWGTIGPPRTHSLPSPPARSSAGSGGHVVQPPGPGLGPPCRKCNACIFALPGQSGLNAGYGKRPVTCLQGPRDKAQERVLKPRGAEMRLLGTRVSF